MIDHVPGWQGRISYLHPRGHIFNLLLSQNTPNALYWLLCCHRASCIHSLRTWSRLIPRLSSDWLTHRHDPGRASARAWGAWACRPQRCQCQVCKQLATISPEHSFLGCIYYLYYLSTHAITQLKLLPDEHLWPHHFRGFQQSRPKAHQAGASARIFISPQLCSCLHLRTCWTSSIRLVIV